MSRSTWCANPHDERCVEKGGVIDIELSSVEAERARTGSPFFRRVVFSFTRLRLQLVIEPICSSLINNDAVIDCLCVESARSLDDNK